MQRSRGQFAIQLSNIKAAKAEILVLDARGVVVERRNVQLGAGGQTFRFN
ncbi:MAG: hypothetical protein WKG06_03600 [Segetibacter sp.]